MYNHQRKILINTEMPVKLVQFQSILLKVIFEILAFEILTDVYYFNEEKHGKSTTIIQAWMWAWVSSICDPLNLKEYVRNTDN